MAVCEIWDVKGSLAHPIEYVQNPEKTLNPHYSEMELQALEDVMNYATNPEKTERKFFVTGVNCDTAAAREEMMLTKAQFQDESAIACYHGFQSFKSGEVTPEQAHAIGVELANRMWGDRFQVIVATHLNTQCLHNHFVVNDISFADGKHYHDNKANLRKLRQLSDELCREHSLSVIENPSGRKKQYALYMAEKEGKPTRDNIVRQAIDEAIQKSYTMRDFYTRMFAMGYRVNYDANRKYWTVIGQGWKRPKRLYRLGEDYTNERIVERIRENSYTVRFEHFAEAQKTVQVVTIRGSLQKARRIKGLRALYLHYCYKLGVFPQGKKQNPARLHYLLKDDLLKMDRIAEETRLLCKHHIDTAEQLFSFKTSLEAEIASVTGRRKSLYSRLYKATGAEKADIQKQISGMTERLKKIRKGVRLCDGIESRNGAIKEKLYRIRDDENKRQREEMLKNEQRRRRGRTGHPHESGRI